MKKNYRINSVKEELIKENIKQFYFTVPKMDFLPSQAPAQETIVILAMAFILERPMPRHCPLYARNRTPLSILFAILWMT